MSKIRDKLYNIALEWEKQDRLDQRDYIPFQGILDELFFHADIRFNDYIQYQDEGEFATRLSNWLKNINEERGKKVLLQLAQSIFFVDRKQIISLYRDAYRRIIVPYISKNVLSSTEMVSIDYEERIISLLREYRLFSITESFENPDFLCANNLSGLLKPGILSEEKYKVCTVLPKPEENLKGLIILEDFVGTGKQSKNVLIEVKKNIPDKWRVIFIPLIILEGGQKTLCEEPGLATFQIKPVLVINQASCISKSALVYEKPVLKHIRAIVNSTRSRVLEKLDKNDDSPLNPFGYKSSGAFIVTCKNTPNNTLPLIHHRAPDWSPLFRRITHSKDGL